MATLAQSNQTARVQRRIVTAALRDLNSFWRTLNLSNPEVARDALMEFMPTLVSEYGNAAGTAAADFYDQMRADAPTRRAFRAAVAQSDDEAVRAATRRVAGSLFEGQPRVVLDGLSAIVDKQVKQVARNTTMQSTRSDPDAVGWERATSGTGCDFCLMLASRGSVYKRDTADFAAHANCGCVAMPSWDTKAPEVSAREYVASERTSTMSESEKEDHRANVASAIAQFKS